jgi:hypothetical protein
MIGGAVRNQEFDDACFVLPLSVDRSRDKTAAVASATRNAGTPVTIGQITSATASKRGLPLCAVRA